ncbi:MAG: hypothetical protein QMD05_10545, partial [Candidatus Brocadiaceae bacterium]|nr:hypothetical protein [Candidatus Brocadiaceae bacterium]
MGYYRRSPKTRKGIYDSLKKERRCKMIGRPELTPYGVRAPVKRMDALIRIPWDKARVFLFSYCRIRPYPAIALILIAVFELSGCYPIPTVPG